MNRLRAWIRVKTGRVPRPVRRVIVVVIGGTLLLLALIGMIVPIMPGVIFLPFALAILAIEFAWAARWLRRVRKSTKNIRDRMRYSNTGTAKVAGVAQSATSDSQQQPHSSDSRHFRVRRS